MTYPEGLGIREFLGVTHDPSMTAMQRNPSPYLFIDGVRIKSYYAWPRGRYRIG